MRSSMPVHSSASTINAGFSTASLTLTASFFSGGAVVSSWAIAGTAKISARAATAMKVSFLIVPPLPDCDFYLYNCSSFT